MDDVFRIWGDPKVVSQMWSPVVSKWSDGFGMILPVLLALILVGTPGSFFVELRCEMWLALPKTNSFRP